MTTGRKTLHDRPTEWKLSLPSSVASEVALFLADPLTGRPRHGARAQLVTQLLRRWLEEQKLARGIQDSIISN